MPRLAPHLLNTTPPTTLATTVFNRASAKCQAEKRKTINGDDLLWALETLEVRPPAAAAAACRQAARRRCVAHEHLEQNTAPTLPNTPKHHETFNTIKQFKEYLAPLRAYLAKYRDAAAAAAAGGKAPAPGGGGGKE